MTVTYSLNVANARLTGFTKLLLRWKGSIYKLLYREVIIFCGLYYLLSMSYRYILSGQQKIIFEKIVDYCRSFTSVIPLSFVLGFYVSIVVTRWWQQFMQIPWPDKAVLLISGYVRGDDERGRIIRRTLARYLVLMQVLTFQAVSTSVRRRFPTLDHIQEVGLFTAEERMAYDEIIGTHGKWWVPAQWFISLIIRARRAGRIKADYLMDKIIEELHVYRTCCGMMFSYDWISIPLVYTQTVSIATYMYFAAAIIGRQYLDHREDQRTTSNDVDYYIPVFTILEFLCFMGWLKVAEQLINPYGEDDDDFELNWCLDRNLLVSYTIVDEMYNKHPKLVPDIFIDKKEPHLPYTKSSINTKLNIHPHMGSTVNLAVEPEDFLPMETIMEEDHEDYNYSSPPDTSMVDYGNQQSSWFQPHHSVQIQMDPESAQQQHAHFGHLHPKFPASKAGSNVSRNHSELIEGLKADSNPPSRPTSRAGMRFIPEFIQESRLVNLLFGSRSNTAQNANLPRHHYQNYSNLTKQHHQNYAQHANNSNTFLLKTPTKKLRHQQQPNTPLLNESSTADQVRGTRSNVQATQSLLVNSNTPFSMNASNASIGNLNAMHNNTSLSATTMNNSQHLAQSHQNLVSGSSAAGGSGPTASRTKSQSTRRNVLDHDDLVASDYDQRYESTSGRNHRNLRLNRTSTLNQPPAAKYANLPTAPVLPTFNSSASAAAKSRMSPFMNRLRNSLNFSSHHYRNLNKLSARNKRSSFSSAISLKSKCDNPAEQLVTSNGFHFPPAYVPPKNPNQYLPLHLRLSTESGSAATLDQENELNNNLSGAANLNKTTDSTDTIEIKISPASRASHRNLNSAEPQSLANLEEEENLIVMDDLSSRSGDRETDQPAEKPEPEKEAAPEETAVVEECRMRSQSSSYTIATAAEILKASNENELAKLKSSTKPSINNQDSQPLTSGTLTGGTLTENHSKSSSTRSSSTELNQDHEISNEKQSLLNKTDPSCSSTEAAATVPTLSVEQPDEEDDEEEADESEKPYSPNEDCHEERYEESPTSSNDSLSPYESNQNTVSSYTQLLEKDKNNGEY